MRKGTYEQYKKRHEADLKAGRTKSKTLSNAAWQAYHASAPDHKGDHKYSQEVAQRQADQWDHPRNKNTNPEFKKNQQGLWNDASDAHGDVHAHISEKKDGHHALRPAHTHHDVHDMMNKHKLEEDDAKELKNFKKAKSDQGQKLSPAELMKRFLQKAKPETKERMKGMDPADFMKMYAAILDDEEPGAAKAASLRERTIRLAHENPELRKHLLPLLKA